LLVIIIFLVVSTTFSKIHELEIKLPVAQANPLDKKDEPINVVVDSEGKYLINDKPLKSNNVAEIASKLKELSNNNNKMPVIIYADAKATHQSVINVMEGSRQAGLTRITFSTTVEQK
jgi:biopolymer transport protein ExbD